MLLIEDAKLRRWLKCGVVAGVSGGADSVAMLRVFCDATKELHRQKLTPQPQLVVAHVNHSLRGDESDRDAAFVKQLADSLSLPYFEKTLTPPDWSRDDTGSIESAARNLRYSFLLEVAENNGLRHIAVAHTRSDQVETVLHRIVRGTGISGLAGIPQVRQLNDAVSIIRPFLHLKRSEVLDYLAEIGQKFCDDSTNFVPKYTRNKIRLELLPHLEQEYNSGVSEAVTQLAQLASEVQEIINEQVELLSERVIIRESKNKIVLDLEELRKSSDYIIRELFTLIWKKKNWPLREMGYVKFNSLLKLVKPDTCNELEAKNFHFPGGVIIEIDTTKDKKFLLAIRRNCE
ncbi:MAG: tRNA lysidine(34) synthetase TilS [Thermoguttaceae bacterium]